MSPCLLGRARNTIWAGGGGGGAGPDRERGLRRKGMSVCACMCALRWREGSARPVCLGVCASLQVEVGQVYWREVGHRLWARRGRGFGVLVSAAEGVGPSRRVSGLCWCWGDRQKGGMVGHEEGESRVGGTGR